MHTSETSYRIQTIEEIRRQVAAGGYDTPERIAGTVDRLGEALGIDLDEPFDSDDWLRTEAELLERERQLQGGRLLSGSC